MNSLLVFSNVESIKPIKMFWSEATLGSFTDKLFQRSIIYIMCMNVLLASIYMHHACIIIMPQWLEEGIRISRTRVIDTELQWWCRNWNQGFERPVIVLNRKQSSVTYKVLRCWFMYMQIPFSGSPGIPFPLSLFFLIAVINCL